MDSAMLTSPSSTKRRGSSKRCGRKDPRGMRLPSAFDRRRSVRTYVYKGLGFFEADEVQDAVALLRYLADPLSNLRAATLLRSRIVRLSDAGLARLGTDPARAILDLRPCQEPPSPPATSV